MFSKHYKGKPYIDKNITVYPISYEWFVNSFTNCEGILCNAGFETPSEALYLGKKLFSIPMKGQYEQECNAEALKQMGVYVLKRIGSDFSVKIENWVNSTLRFHEKFKNTIPAICEMIFEYAEKYKGTNDFDCSKIIEELEKTPGNNKTDFLN